MKSFIEKRVSQLRGGKVRALLQDRKVGLEKESLRVARDGRIASTSHPQKLGSALTHPYITTDYSEALLEFVTPPFSGIDDTLKFLDDTHRFVYSQLDGEILWATSMPCIVEGDPSIPIAQYGSSNAGKMKTAYRRGLGHRYGRMMQTISGVHYNYSFSPGLWEVFRELTGDRREAQDFISEYPIYSVPRRLFAAHSCRRCPARSISCMATLITGLMQHHCALEISATRITRRARQALRLTTIACRAT